MKKICFIFIGLLLCMGGYAQISEVYPFNDGRARIRTDSGYCFIDKTGKRVTGFYAEASDFSEGMAAVRANDICYFIDQKEQTVLTLPSEYIAAQKFAEGLAAVGKEDKNSLSPDWGYIDKTGREVIACRYAYAGDFSNGVAYVRNFGTGTTTAYINKAGEKVKKPDAGQQPGEPVLSVKNNLFGYVDANGREIIPFKYSRAGYFEHGVAKVEKNVYKSGAATTSTRVSKLTTQEEWRTTTTRYSPGSYHTKFFYINRKGKKMKFDYIGDYSEGMLMVIKFKFLSKKYGYMDENHKTVISPVYDNATRFGNGLALVQTKDDNWIIIDWKGKKISAVNVD
jgi:hypothetical protein